MRNANGNVRFAQGTMCDGTMVAGIAFEILRANYALRMTSYLIWR